MKRARLPAWVAAQGEDIAAVVIYSPDRREAVVLHVLGPEHPAAVATRARLTRHGVHVLDTDGKP